MKRITVGVLRGGPSNEYEVSLNSGAAVLAEIDRAKYDPRDIFISRKGEWHVNGVGMDPQRALRSVDVAFNAMHGEYGEDGTVQRLLETIGTPYTGSDALSSGLSFNKQRTKEAVEKLGIKVPRGILLERSGDPERQALEIFRSFPMPAMVKPLTGGSSVGMTLATDFFSLQRGIELALQISPRVLVEEFIQGREATVGVIESFRGQEVYPLFPVEIIPPPTCAFFDYEAKYSGATKEICPGNFAEKEKGTLADLAKEIHTKLHLRDYSRADFIVSKRGTYFLEVNTLPGLTRESLFPKAVKAVGAKLSEFFTHVLDRTYNR